MPHLHGVDNAEPAALLLQVVPEQFDTPPHSEIAGERDHSVHPIRGHRKDGPDLDVGRYSDSGSKGTAGDRMADMAGTVMSGLCNPEIRCMHFCEKPSKGTDGDNNIVVAHDEVG